MSVAFELFDEYLDKHEAAYKEGESPSYEDWLELQLTALRADNEKLKAFGNDIFYYRECDIIGVDGSEMEEIGIKHGLLVSFEVTKSCGDGCVCAVASDFPQQCINKSELLKPSTEGEQ